MKNILVVGNGFDLALNLQTNYVHFANSKYWTLNDENFAKGGGWRKRSILGQSNGGRWDTFDEAKLMIFS